MRKKLLYSRTPEKNMSVSFLVYFAIKLYKLLYSVRIIFYSSEISKRFVFENRHAPHCFVVLVLSVKNILQLFSSTLSG